MKTKIQLTEALRFLLPYLERALPEASEKAVNPEAIINFYPMGGAPLADSSVPVANIALPWVIGTGMTGATAKMARAVARGTWCHVAATEGPHINTVHASDVAEAARLLAGRDVTVTLTDGSYPTTDALAEALAFRMENKRIITLPRWLGKLTGSVSRAGDGEKLYIPPILSQAGWTPTPVCHYLRTHVYDENSL